MKIRSLTLTNFRRFENLKIRFDAGLTVFVAVNGAGKTSILDALAICLGAFLTRLPGVKGMNPAKTDFRMFHDRTRPAYMRLQCELEGGVVWDRTELRDKSKKTATEVPKALGLKQLNEYADSFIDAVNEKRTVQFPIILYYGAGRGVFDVPARKSGFNMEFNRFDAYHECLGSRTNFRRFVEYFYALETRESQQQKALKSFDFQLPELKAIRNAVQRALPEISKPRVALPAGIMVNWILEGKEFQLNIEQLSDGYRTTLAMIMDIAARMAEANPEMEDPLQAEGVVMIDEVELHLHPGWQQTILANLRSAFPLVQFIVTTHSSQILTTAAPECIQIIDWRTGSPQVLPVEFSKGAESQQLLRACELAGVDPVLVARTIDELNLDTQRLRDLRKALLEKINDEIGNEIRKGQPVAEIRIRISERLFIGQNDRSWPSFFSALREYLGKAAEERLISIGYSG